MDRNRAASTSNGAAPAHHLPGQPLAEGTTPNAANGSSKEGNGHAPAPSPFDVEAADAGAADLKDVEAAADRDVRLAEALEHGERPKPFAAVGYKDIAKQFSILGWTAFGGPSAHIGLFERILVERLRWMSTATYAELFALGQCMPGPTSTQVSFAIGTIKKGVSGGLLSGVLFQYPGAIIMTCVGVFAAKLLESPTGWLDGLTAGVSAVGVALVATAGKSMAMKLCATPILAAICTGAIVIAYYWPKAYTFPCLIILGGLINIAWSYFKKLPVPKAKDHDNSVQSVGLNFWMGGIVLAVWLAVLIVTLVLNSTLESPPLPLQWWVVFYRIGSIIYGGGQVVLPMLYESVVQQTCNPQGVCVDAENTWVTSKQFYAGLGVVQAMPGPLFNFSSYLGAIIAMQSGYVFILGVVIAWFGLFSPGILIIFGILPYWGRFRKWSLYRRALPGLNAAGIGLIITSVFSLTLGALEQSPFPKTSLCLGILAFTAVDQLKWFEPIVVVLGGVLGIGAWGVGLS